MAHTMLEEDASLPPQQSQLEAIKDIAGIAYLAGSDTMVAAIISLFLAMLLYPDVQAKAQAEVDRVVGRGRLPELEDRKELPYVEGIVNECLRWFPVVPMGDFFLSIFFSRGS
jgi:cytochrome P450